jgi:hypothetical protein
MIIGAVGIFFGFYWQADDPKKSLDIVTLTTVGAVGLLAFIRHVIFYRSDARRLGWETDRPDWIFEVGFANLAFGCMAILAVSLQWGAKVEIIVLCGYALYLLQAALLHGYRYLSEEPKSPARLWRSCLATLLFAGMMGYFAYSSLPL